MSAFTPYLREGDLIKVKALPFIGLQWGPEFDVPMGKAKVMMVPPQWMELPRAKALSMDSVELEWDQILPTEEVYDVYKSREGNHGWTRITPQSIPQRKL